MTKVNLRQPPAIKTLEPLAPDGSAGFVGLPMGVGRLVKRTTMTPAEQKVLEELKLNPAEGIPNNLAEILDDEVQKALADVNYLPPGVPPNFKLDPPKSVRLQDLPPNKRQEVIQAVQSYTETLRAEADQSAMEAKRAQTLTPAAAQAVSAIERQISPSGRGMQLVDDVSQAPVSPPVQTPISPPISPPAAATPPAPLPDGGAGVDGPPLCPHCQWDQRHPDPIVVTEADQNEYLESILGLRPFVKEYPFFGGRLTLKLRSLEISEANACSIQADREMKEGKIISWEKLWERVSHLRVGLQLLDVEGTTPGFEFPESLAAWGPQVGDADETDLPARTAKVFAYLEKNLLGNETICGLLWDTVTRFNLLVKKLRDLALRPDFTEATDTAG